MLKTPVLLCFDGSDDAAAAIAMAGEILGARKAVVLSVWKPAPAWQPYDPATIITAPVSRLASNALGARRDRAGPRRREGDGGAGVGVPSRLRRARMPLRKGRRGG
jgi:hypothetical protein